jgi:hypothetical protein
VEGNLDAFEFVLAEKLGMTLAEIGEMSNNEFIRWRAFYSYRAAQRELQSKKG